MNVFVRYKKIRNHDITALEFENGEIIENDSEIPKAFNDYFVTICSNLANKFPGPSSNSCGKSCSVTSLIKPNPNYFFLHPISAKKVYIYPS